IWNAFYKGINNTNTVISRANALDEMDSDTRSAKIAEARFLRAHYYFVLVQHFGPISITTEETTAVELEATRSPVEDVYELIIDDLTFAIDNLPLEQSDYGRPTNFAAMNHLAKVHLTIGNWELAADLAVEVIEQGPYELLDDYADVFDPFNQRHDEVIWSLQWGDNPEVNNPDNQLQRYFGPREWLIDGLIGTDMYHTGIARFRPTEYAMTEIFGNDYRQGGLNIQNDVRYEVSFKEAWPYNDPANMPSNVAVGDTAAWFTIDPIINEMTDQELEDYAADRGIQEVVPMRKWNTTYFSTIQKHRYPYQRNHGRDYMYMRLGETYLIAAEALMMDNRPTEAVHYFNILRKRAEAPGETIPTITEADLSIDLILDERARELAGELHRWTDLKRTEKLLERARIGNPNAAPNIQEHHRLRPIPQHQIDRTQNEYGQNPGY
ncbi:MAG: RagB/SusD family nutrient uptake outer membrane protein, partial [Bacteroidota bacterium]